MKRLLSIVLALRIRAGFRQDAFARWVPYWQVWERPDIYPWKKPLPRMMLMLALLMAGCASTPDAPPVVVDNDWPTFKTNYPPHDIVRGVFVGLTETSADGDNDCPGCDVDVETLSADAQADGVEVVKLLNEQCQWEAIKAKVFEVIEGMTEDSMLVLMESSHGARLPDDNGDEADGYDEALVLYGVNGATVDIVRDDRVLTELIVEVWKRKPKLDIMLITDTCHSEGNFKAFWRAVTFSNPDQLELFDAKELSRVDVTGGLIQIAMCREDSYSYGAVSGGTGTQTLLRALKVKSIRRKEAFDKLAETISGQEPQWVEYGNVSDRLRYGEFWK